MAADVFKTEVRTAAGLGMATPSLALNFKLDLQNSHESMARYAKGKTASRPSPQRRRGRHQSPWSAAQPYLAWPGFVVFGNQLVGAFGAMFSVSASCTTVGLVNLGCLRGSSRP